MERRLAAILAADVGGYSRLMGEDEAGTLTALNIDSDGDKPGKFKMRTRAATPCRAFAISCACF